MKAVQISGVREIGIVDIPEPEPRNGDALIEVKAMGICGSDVHAYAGRSPNVSYPVRIGHEIAGIVTRLPEGVSGESDVRLGDHVVVNPYIGCGHCYPCSQGRMNCCEHLSCLGVQVDGAMTERFAHPANLLIKVPKEMDWESCALIEPTVIALHALHHVTLKPGEHVAVNGAGCIGMLIGMIALAQGGIPIMIDVVDQRLELARNLGMKYTINALKQDAITEIRKVTGGRMAECVCEVSGHVAGVRNTLDFAAPTGRIALTGWPDREVLLPTALITRKELRICGSRTGLTEEFREALEMLNSGILNLRKIISKIVTLEEIPAAIRELDAHPGESLKVIALNHC